MTLIEYYITNLVSERIPMINEWALSTGLQIKKTYQTEQSAFEVNSVKSEKMGYAFLDRLERGYLSHQQMSEEYSNETHYLLGMYLRALKEQEGLDFMHLYNCVQSYEDSSPSRYYHIPVIKGRTYSLRANTYFPIYLDLKYSLDGSSLLGSRISLSTQKANAPIILGSEESLFNWENISEDKFKTNLEEYLELVIETHPNTKVAVVEGDFSEPHLITENSPVLKPSVLFNYKRFSDKLIEVLLDTIITDKSNYKIKEKALQLYPADSIAQAAKKYTSGIYDIDDYIDKRLRV